MTTNPIVLKMQSEKIMVENRFGNTIAIISKFDTEFSEPVTEAELKAICKVVIDFNWYSEILTK